MTRKKVAIKIKPETKKQADAWVSESPQEEQGTKQTRPEPTLQKTKRLTIDIPETLHRTLKIKAAVEGVRMADLVRSWIQEKCNV